jgi:hypothetical protein
MSDLNKKLENFVLEAQGHAAKHRELAEAIRSEPGAAGGWPEYDREREQRARINDESAKRWTERAEYAKKGQVLVHPDDLHFQHKYQKLIGKAAHCQRAVFVEPQQGPKMPL